MLKFPEVVAELGWGDGSAGLVLGQETGWAGG